MLSFFSRLNKREKLVFYGAAIFLILAVMDRSVIGPILNKIKSLDEKIASQTGLIKKNARIIAEKERINKARQDFVRFSRDAGTQEEEVAFLFSEVERLARKSSLYIVNMKPLGLQEDDHMKRYSLDLNCEGQMEQLVSFMYDVESSELLLQIDRFNIAPKSREANVAKCNIRITHAIFV